MDPMLESRVTNRLHEKKRGQTVQELADFLKKTESEILTVLKMLQKEGYAKMSEKGVWMESFEGLSKP